MSDLSRLGVKLDAVAKGIEHPRVIKAAGMAGKKAVLDVARDVSGGDGRLSGWGRAGLKLGAGFDQSGPSQVTVNLRPVGPWTVMERGRRGGKPIRPKRRSGKRAVSTPQGPRARSTVGAMAGKGAVTKAQQEAGRKAPEAAQREVQEILREVFR